MLVAGTLAALAVEIPPTLAQEPAFGLELAPPVISPNGDGRADRTLITVTTTAPGHIVVRVLQDDIERNSWEADVIEPAETAFEWDGRDADGSRVADGTYTIEATVTDPATLLTERATRDVIVDTKRPGASWVRIRPKPGTGRRTWRFTFRLADRASLLHVRLPVKDFLGQGDVREEDVPPGTTVIEWRPKIRDRALPPRTYRVSLRAVDDAGNRSRKRVKRFRVERPVSPRVFRRLSGTGGRVAITIDDCHYADAWSRMLTTLRNTKVKATFFCPGDRMLLFPALVRRTVREGHTLGSHGWDHADLARQGFDTIRRKLRRDADTAWQLARVTTAPYFRPPYGSYDATVLSAAGRTGHGRVIMWDVSTEDIRRPGAPAIRASAVHGARSGSIILMHTLDQTADALPAIIRGLRDKGLRPVSLPRLFSAAGYV